MAKWTLAAQRSSFYFGILRGALKVSETLEGTRKLESWASRKSSPHPCGRLVRWAQCVSVQGVAVASGDRKERAQARLCHRSHSALTRFPAVSSSLPSASLGVLCVAPTPECR